MNAAVGALLFCIVLLGAVTCRAKPAYYDEQNLNYIYTEFCASVKKPPPGLVESIDAAFEKDKSVGEIWLWIHDIAEKVRVRCGNA